MIAPKRKVSHAAQGGSKLKKWWHFQGLGAHPPIGCGNQEQRSESVEKKTEHVYVEK
jgi:hypothetical protein